jgi:hypothetical protein
MRRILVPMADHEPFVTIGDDLLPRLQRLRDWAERSAPPEVYMEIVDVCIICEALANPEGDWNKTVDIRDVAARLQRQGIHLLKKSESD